MKLEGEIGEIKVIEHLVEMGRERFTGAIRFENDGIIKIIYFKEGDVLSASTNDRADSVDEILLRAGKIGREHIKQALAKRKENETLGDALLNLGFITRKELTWARRVQVIGVIRSIEAWTAGQYTVVADYLPKREEGTLFPLPQIIIELIVTDQERQKYERELNGGNAVFEKASGFDEGFRRLGLNEDADAIVAQVDGIRTAAEVASVSGKDAFNVYKLMHALAILGLLARRDKAQGTPELSLGTPDDYGFATAGVADAADLWGESPPRSEEPPHSFGIDLPPMGGPVEEAPVVTPEQADASFGSLPAWEAPAPIPEPTVPVAPLPPLDVPPRGPSSTPPWETRKAPVAPSQEQWGFDEAQIETARRATVPKPPERVPPPMREVVKKASKPNRPVAALLGAVGIVILTFAGYAGWTWWQSRSASSVAEVAPAAPRHRVQRPPVTATETAAATTAETPAGISTARPPMEPAATVKPANAAPLTAAAQKARATASGAAPVSQIPAPVSSGTRVERGTAGATITNSGAAGAVAHDATKAHFDEMARTFAAQASGNYTVQFELVCETPSLATAVREGGQNIWFVPFSYRNRACYRVFWGHYGTRDEAAKAVGEIPRSLRGAAPVVVSVPKP